MGIRKKIMLGFTVLGLLLFFSGLISYFELNRLSKVAKTSIDNSYRTMELSKTMLDAVQDQNTALLKMLMAGGSSYDSALVAGRARFAAALEEVKTLSRDPHLLDSVQAATLRYNNTVERRINDPLSEQGNVEWFMEVYEMPYSALTSSIKNFMISSHRTLDNRTVQLENNAYRAIMPGVIALGIAILLILMFFYFVDTYYIRPVLRINQALGLFLRSKVPFKVTMEGRDEVYQLKENVETLVEQAKNNKHE